LTYVSLILFRLAIIFKTQRINIVEKFEISQENKGIHRRFSIVYNKEPRDTSGIHPFLLIIG
jgi:hypothetical protein